MDAWLALAVVGVVPWLTVASRAWFFNSPRCVLVWISLIGAAALSLAAILKVVPGNTGGEALAATPLMQAAVFVIADRIFLWLAGRAPVSYNAAKWNRRPDGRRWWPDKAFWILTFFGLMLLGVFVCAHFGVEFPSRR
jgi:hypothetical protein